MKKFKKLTTLISAVLVGFSSIATTSVVAEEETQENVEMTSVSTDYTPGNYSFSDGALGVAGNFHLVGFDSVTNKSHTNGNILTKELNYGSNFGTRGLAGELSYIQNINAGGSIQFGYGDARTLVVGSGVTIGTTDNDNAYTLNGNKLEGSSITLWQSDNFIDIDSVESSMISLNQTLRGYSATVEGNFSDQNNQTITIADTEGANVAVVPTDKLGNTITVKGYDASKKATLIINVDLAGQSDFSFAGNEIEYTDGNKASHGEVTEWASGNVLWNFYDSSANDGLYRGTIHNTRATAGHILAPAANVSIDQNLNGTVIANVINVNAESHRSDFTGTTLTPNSTSEPDEPDTPSKEEQIAAAEKAVEEAQAKADAANAVINEGSKGYFESKKSDKAVSYVSNPPKYAEYTNLGKAEDATSLENMKTALDTLKTVNEYRVKGDSNYSAGNELKISDELVAIAQVQSNASGTTRGHTSIFSVAENLAWGTTASGAADYWYTEKADYDAALSKHPEIKGMSNWELYSTYPDVYSNTGHYLNMMDAGATVAGVAYNKYSSCGSTVSLVTSNTNPGVSLADYTADFNDYYTEVTTAAATANTELATAKANLEALTSGTEETTKYTVTFYDEDGTTVISSKTYDEGATIEYPANPTKAEDDDYTYTFKEWVLVSGDSSTTATSNTVYKASYTATAKEKTPETYTIAVMYNEEEGTVSDNSCGIKLENGKSYEVEAGSNFELLIEPNNGYKIGIVNVDGKEVTLTGNTYTFNDISDDHVVRVLFDEVPAQSDNYTLTVTYGDGGAIYENGVTKLVNGMGYKVSAGYPVSLYVAADDGYVIDTVTLDSEVDDSYHRLTSDSIIINSMDEDHSIDVTFKKASDMTYVLKMSGNAATSKYGESSGLMNKIPSDVTKLVFTDDVAPAYAELIDVDDDGDGGVVGWVEDGTMYISTQKEGQPVVFPANSSQLFSATSNSHAKLKEIVFDNIDTSNVTNMNNMFNWQDSLQSLDLSNFDTSNVTDMGGMFTACKSLTELDLTYLDTSKITYMDNMFGFCENLETIYVNEGFVPNGVTVTYYMFTGCNKLTGQNGTKHSELQQPGTEYYKSNNNVTKWAVIDTDEHPGFFSAKTASVASMRINIQNFDDNSAVVDKYVYETDVDDDGYVTIEIPQIDGYTSYYCGEYGKPADASDLTKFTKGTSIKTSFSNGGMLERWVLYVANPEYTIVFSDTDTDPQDLSAYTFTATSDEMADKFGEIKTKLEGLNYIVGSIPETLSETDDNVVEVSHKKKGAGGTEIFGAKQVVSFYAIDSEGKRVEVATDSVQTLEDNFVLSDTTIHDLVTGKSTYTEHYAFKNDFSDVTIPAVAGYHVKDTILSDTVAAVTYTKDKLPDGWTKTTEKDESNHDVYVFTYEIEYEQNESKDVTVHFNYEDGSKASDDVTKDVVIGLDYKIEVPEIEGYDAMVDDEEVSEITGTMTEDGKEVTVTYVAHEHNVVIDRKYEDGRTIDNNGYAVKYGKTYEYEITAIDDYTAYLGNKAVEKVSGTMEDEDITYEIVYKQNKHNVVVHYVYEDGTKAAEDQTFTNVAGTAYTLLSPDIKYYTADKESVKGTLTTEDVEYTVTYKKIPADDVKRDITGIVNHKPAEGQDEIYHTVDEWTLDLDGQEITVKNGVQGVLDTVKYGESAVGEHTYTVKQIAGDDETIVYDDNVFTITDTVEFVKETNSLELTRKIVDKDGNEVTSVEFDNIDVVPNKTNTTIEGLVEKNGEKTSENHSYSFKIFDSEGNENVVNSDEGYFSYKTEDFTKPGKYTYKITQVAGTDKTLNYDDSENEVTVTVTREGNDLITTIGYKNENSSVNNATYFNNTTAKTKTIGYAISGTKRLNEKDPTCNAFTFTESLATTRKLVSYVDNRDGKTYTAWADDINPNDKDYTIKSSSDVAYRTDSVIETVKNDGAKVNFSEVAFDYEGTYTFTVKEAKGTNNAINYDTNVYTVTVKVVKNWTTNAYEISDVTIVRSGNTTVSDITFKNTVKSGYSYESTTPTATSTPTATATPTATPSVTNPNDADTGDNSLADDAKVLGITLGVIAVAAVAVFVVYRKKENDDGKNNKE